MYGENLGLFTDEELIGLVQKHKYGAFRELVTRYIGDFFNFAFHFSYDYGATKTIIEKIFIDIWTQPYLYNSNFKIAAYRNIIKKTKKYTNKNIRNEKLRIFSPTNILALNLYYFGTLKASEIEVIFPNIDNELKQVGAIVEDNYGAPMGEFILELNTENSHIFEIKREIIKNTITRRQRDKHQTAIIIFSAIPIIILIIIVAYSIMAGRN